MHILVAFVAVGLILFDVVNPAPESRLAEMLLYCIVIELADIASAIKRKKK